MQNEQIELGFFEAFGIDKVRECELRSECFLGFAHTCDKCDIYGQAFAVYPPITPEIVLGLEEIVLLINDDYNFSVEHFDNEARFIFCDKRIILENESNLKDCILSSCIQLEDKIQNQVKALFKC